MHHTVRVFGDFTFTGNPANLVIGEHSTINQGCFINARSKVIIGKHVHLSPYSQIHTGLLQVSGCADSFAHNERDVLIDDYSWIASGAIVSAGTHLGEHTIVGANSVVLASTTGYVLVAGVPAIPKKYYPNLPKT